jgi:AcrR family transcriptional regulator
MVMPKKSLAPKQARSRESSARLMAAAREILNEKGIEGATVPRVAARAGLSAGSVYRRFPNKDALMRAVILETLEALDAAAAAGLTPDLAERLSLREFVEAIVRHRLAGQRRNAKMLRAMLQFTLSHTNVAFKKRTVELNARSTQRVADFLMLKRAEIDHPDPAKALPFALMLMGAMLQQAIVLDPLPGVPDPRLPSTDEELVEEIARAFLGYLGAGKPDTPRP